MFHALTIPMTVISLYGTVLMFAIGSFFVGDYTDWFWKVLALGTVFFLIARSIREQTFSTYAELLDFKKQNFVLAARINTEVFEEELFQTIFSRDVTYESNLENLLKDTSCKFTYRGEGEKSDITYVGEFKVEEDFISLTIEEVEVFVFA